MPCRTDIELPRAPGTYVLIMRAKTPAPLEYGRRRFDLQPGWYLYVGSAMGPGGLAARLGHHLRRSERPRWHIDHLRRQLPAVAIWMDTSGRRLEHAWADCLGRGCDHGVPRFGASDCDCNSHLFGIAREPDSLLLGQARHSRYWRLARVLAHAGAID